MKKRSVIISSILGTILMAIPMQSQAFFCGFGGGFSFGGGGWGYPYYAGYYPGNWGYGGYPYYGHSNYGYPYYGYGYAPVYSYPVATALPAASAPKVVAK